eukprot:4850958-Alexandrium_andersonii.AAC.1
MSASLVGSEMCIRDRQAEPGPQGQQLRAGGRERQEGCGRRDVDRHQEAVSYTHLTLPTICSV